VLVPPQCEQHNTALGPRLRPELGPSLSEGEALAGLRCFRDRPAMTPSKTTEAALPPEVAMTPSKTTEAALPPEVVSIPSVLDFKDHDRQDGGHHDRSGQYR
jgi:hypothetical protein